ncbi:hypothetical protein TRICI_006335 [Trichomonascus ciferrii]|uniref:tRNA-splicing endonuclease subunit Sen34 n=1 Tax=Trichomonascus ciferrii TaxID=44093 RepID=A0A642UIA5_9ASCO|nr:hypothetical protein TRICI_006335 [Trichomonascus ciferrii]
MSSSIPINVVGGRALIYDIEHLKRLREEYHICGTLVGILPQVPQQNVFMGLPLELMPEDVYYLVEDLKVAHVVDDKAVHKSAVERVNERDLETLRKKRSEEQEAQMAAHREMAWRKRQDALERKAKKKGEVFIPEGEEKKKEVLGSMADASSNVEIPSTSNELPGYDTFRHQGGISQLLVRPSVGRYNMYKYLHEKGYFLSPGIRFGGQFLAYPGDPLRFHSHHTAIGFEDDEKFGVLDIVGGGRLGTAVKKCWVVGAQNDEEYRAYSVEWAGFG